MASAATLYQPVTPYQTRILRLHGDGGDARSQLRADLFVADLLHTLLGLGVRPLSGREYSTTYTALSYTWDRQQPTHGITLNNKPHKITKNLYEALERLRLHGRESVHVWADAICIDQNNKHEKARQITRMLEIYEKAKEVVVWLGPVSSDLRELIKSADSGSPEDYENEDTQRIIVALNSLYNRSWFRRMWIQQEIAAAKSNLYFQLRSHRVKWQPKWSHPERIKQSSGLKPYSDDNGGKWNPFRKKVPENIKTQLTAVSDLQKLHDLRLGCFEHFTKPPVRGIDIVESLLLTSPLEAAEELDHIYAILGMSKYPAEAISFTGWLRMRREINCIPVDYSIDMATLLTAVTWSLILKGGLSILAKFKVFNDSNDSAHRPRLPSWVIDWDLAATVFEQIPIQEIYKVVLSGAWSTVELKVDYMNSDHWVVERQETPQHIQFRQDNMANTVDASSILLRGAIDHRFSVGDDCVYEKHMGMDRIAWKLSAKSRPTDIVVYFEAAQSYHFHKIHRTFRSRTDLQPLNAHSDHSKPQIDGLWLLRPETSGRHRLIACLLLRHDSMWDGKEVLEHRRFLYNHWYAKPSDVPERAGLRRLSITKVKHKLTSAPYTPPKFGDKGVNYRTFTIV